SRSLVLERLLRRSDREERDLLEPMKDVRGLLERDRAPRRDVAHGVSSVDERQDPARRRGQIEEVDLRAEAADALEDRVVARPQPWSFAPESLERQLLEGRERRGRGRGRARETEHEGRPRGRDVPAVGFHVEGERREIPPDERDRTRVEDVE